MNHDDVQFDGTQTAAKGTRPWTSWLLVCFLAVAGFFLLTEHRAHLFGALPYLLLLACPLIHLFHHRGHRSRSWSRPGSVSSQH